MYKIENQRIIGSYQGVKKGLLMVVVGAMHGNEAAGLKALPVVFEMLENEPIRNPNFIFSGKVIGIKGNMQAIEKNQRFIEKDLNREWTVANVEKIKQSEKGNLSAESLEIREIIDLINAQIKDYQPSKLVFLDIHTTSAEGGVFTVASANEESVELAKKLQVPVVQGLIDKMTGTSLHYFIEGNIGIPTISLCFEAGQHQETAAVNRAIAAIISCMQAIGCVEKKDVNPKHTKILYEYGKNLPAITSFFYCHKIQANDHFKMQAGFSNFQKITKGTSIAMDKNGAILAPEDCLILMPLYQTQGDDGFFLVKEKELLFS